MESFEQRGGLRRTLGEQRTSPIPPALRWEQASAGILQGVKKRQQQQKFRWFLGSSVALGVLLLLFWLMPQQEVVLSYFPTDEVLPDSCKTMLWNDKNKSQVHTQTQPNQQIPFQKIAIQLAPDLILPNENKNAPPLQSSPQLASPTLTSKEIDSTFVANDLSPIVVEPIPHVGLILLKYPDQDLTKNFNSSVQPQKTASWQLELAGYGTYFYPGYKNVNTDSGTPADFETPLPGWQAGIRLYRKFGKHGRLGTGLQWQHLRYRSQFEERKEVNLYRPNTVDTVFVNAFTGERTYVYRDSVPGVRTRQFQHYNQHNALQIPLLVGYEMKSARWNLGMQSGLNFHLNHQSRGRTMAPPNEVIDLSDANFYATSLRLSYLLEAQLQYRVGIKQHVFTRLGWEKHLTDWLNPEVGFSQRPGIFYLGAGMSWQLR